MQSYIIFADIFFKFTLTDLNIQIDFTYISYYLYQITMNNLIFSTGI